MYGSGLDSSSSRLTCSGSTASACRAITRVGAAAPATIIKAAAEMETIGSIDRFGNITSPVHMRDP
jgi:hypothetical protein